MQDNSKDEAAQVVQKPATEYGVFVGDVFYNTLHNTANRKQRRSGFKQARAYQKLAKQAMYPHVLKVVNAINKKQTLWDALFKRAGITA